MTSKIWFFIIVLSVLIWVGPSEASRISTTPVPGAKPLGVYLNDIDANFIELYRLIVISELGFTGLSGAIITSGIVDESRIDVDIARMNAVNALLNTKMSMPTGDGSRFLSSDGTYKVIPASFSWDTDSDSFIDVAFIPPAIARLTSIPVAGIDYLSPAAVAAAISTAVGNGTADKQNADDDLTTWAGITPSVNTISLLSSANYDAMRALLDLETGTDFYSTSTVDLILTGKQNVDADLIDLSDGSLTGSKVGPGISASNVTTDTLPDAVIPVGITRSTELASILSGYTTSSVLTTLLDGKMGTATGTPDGTKFLRDDMTWQIPSNGGGDDWDSNNDSIIDIGYLPASLISDTELNAILSGFVTSGGDDGTRGMWWTNPNTVPESMPQEYGLYPTTSGIRAKWLDDSSVSHDIIIGTGGESSLPLVTSTDPVVPSDTTVMTTSAVMNYINTQVDHLVNMKLADAGFTICNYLTPAASPANVTNESYTLSGNVYDNGTVPLVEVALNGGTYIAANVSGAVSPWTWSKVLTLVLGANTIDTRVTNSASEVIQLPQVIVNYTN